MKVYLAGPIGGCSDDQCVSWRQKARQRLHAVGHEVIDPMRRDYRGAERGNAHRLVAEDKEDIRKCDAVIANCWKPSTGTSMEILWAHVLGVPVVVVAPEPCSPWLTAHAIVATSLDQAIDIVAGEA